MAFTVPDYYQRAEAHPSAAFGGFRDPVDGYYLFYIFLLRLFDL